MINEMDIKLQQNQQELKHFINTYTHHPPPPLAPPSTNPSNPPPMLQTNVDHSPLNANGLSQSIDRLLKVENKCGGKSIGFG